MPSQGSSLARIDAQSLALAFKAKTFVQAFEHPTVAMAVRELGVRDVLVLMTGAITAAMDEYFSPEQRLDPTMCANFAEAVMEDYSLESVGDVSLFIKYAARGKYGKINERKLKDGRIEEWVSDRGQTFGRLTLPRLLEWWKQYLWEKADALSEHRIDHSRSLNGTRNEPLLPPDKIISSMRTLVEEREQGSDGRNSGMRVASLLRKLPVMNDEDIFRAWEKAETQRERDTLFLAAKKRKSPLLIHMNKGNYDLKNPPAEKAPTADNETVSMMRKCWNDCLLQVAERCLGRPFEEADAGRFRTTSDPSNDLMGVVFDHLHVCTLKGSFVEEDGKNIYRVTALQ